MYTAKLIKGKTYNVMGVTFRAGVSQTVPKRLYEYLNENPYFVLNQELNNQKDDPINYTESELKGMNKAEHESIISNLGGNPSDFKNADERVAYILNQIDNKGE
ncbi:YqbF domain-containing protein [Bacillus spizizenii]|uniref:YqbF domain-containing protein n=1 Tax=Bacillus spizizenii TaxID=96241 RepID=UPI00227FCF3E|nr:YqbF domain-containing protein [Bacillus spizizenii]MCY7807136.1 YqbF domain-containing protein [Bacillus spizizenii]MCY8761528.1 YqbF domain-containing protein [Bacillus spizizenii]MEC1569635.1 YqbF domain-containing protein [Bacillus spizizenii]